MCGVATVDISEVQKQGRTLTYQRDGRTIPIHRIYNRVIIDGTGPQANPPRLRLP